MFCESMRQTVKNPTSDAVSAPTMQLVCMDIVEMPNGIDMGLTMMGTTSALEAVIADSTHREPRLHIALRNAAIAVLDRDEPGFTLVTDCGDGLMLWATLVCREHAAVNVVWLMRVESAEMLDHLAAQGEPCTCCT